MGVKLLTSRAIIGSFFAALEQGDTSWVNDLAFKTGSDQESETYGWLGMAPTMRKWVGGRQAHGFRESSLVITNEDFEATLEVLVSELRRDKSGQVLIRIAELADRTNAHAAKLLSALIVNGESNPCYDGQYFFDTDHLEGESGTQSNALSVDISELAVSNHGVVAAPSVGEMREVIMRLIQQILGFKDDQGEPMNETARDFAVMVPISLWATALSAVNLPMVDSGETNIIPNLDGFRIRVVANVRLPWTDKVTAFRADGRVAPFILQEEVPVNMKAIAEGSELEFSENKHHYGVEWVGNVGYGYWQHACQAQMT